MTITCTTRLSDDTLALIEEFNSSHEGLDPITSEQGALHEALHAYLGLGVSLEEEELVLNCTNLLIGRECSPHLALRCERLLGLLPTDVLIELSSLLIEYAQ